MVIHSPHAGRSAILAHALRALEHAGVEIAEVLPIAAVADGSGLVQQWKAKGIDLIVAAGGDGVVGSAARHALDGKLPLGILPLGTANDLARSVGIPQDISSAAQIIAAGTVCLIDLGLARPLLLDEPPASHPFPHSGQPKLFAHALTVGFSVQFAQVATNKAIRQRYGRLTYPFALWQAFKTYRPIDAEIHLQGIALRSSLSSALFPMIKKDHLSLSGRIAQVTAANAPIFWGTFEGRVPGVSFTDRLLDLVIFEETSWYQLAQRMLHFFTSRFPHAPSKQSWHAQYSDLLSAEITTIPGIHHVQAQSVTIFTDNEPQAVTLDGEVCLQTPVEARVANEQLQILVPEETGWNTTSNQANARLLAKKQA